MSLSWKHINGLKQMKAVVALVVILLSCVAEAGTLRVMNYNVSNNPDNATEDASFRTVFEAVGTENVSGVAKRIDLLAIAETDTGSSARLPIILNDLYGVSTYQVIISSPDGGNDRTGLVYDASTLILLDHVELNSGLTHHTVRAMFGTLGADRLDDFFVYAIHLKSGATSSDKTVRATEMQIIRDDADNLGVDANIIYAGDFNLHGSSEGAWINMTALGHGQGFDAADAPGEWRDNPTFIELHTQDPRGNMDDRFDFQFVSGELLDDVGLDFIDGSYRVFGNDGTHTMGDAISSGTGATPMVLVALEENSDHLPVVVDYFVPLAGESSCSADMVVETNIRYKDGMTIGSEVGIVTSGTVVVETSATVRYYAPQIELASGFQVESGGLFRAVTEAVDCSAFSP